MTQQSIPPPPSEAPPVQEGDILAGKYRVERVLGAGGMGVVVAATHLQLDQRVALKFVLPEAVSSPEAIERFAREARAAAKLKSDHVARVIDVGTLESGAPYMVMEYLEGRDLSQHVDQVGPLPFVEAVDYLLQTCEAMAEAHALGIIHRDLKPQNLFLTSRVDGRALIKVLDFGISKFNPSSGSGENMSLTKTQAVMGSPNYMSPEQLRSAKLVDARTDIWALGVILYELLVGKVPFQATSVTELCAMVLQDTPHPVRELRPDVPEALAEAIARCLEKDANLRFPSIASLAHALEPFGPNVAMGAAQRILAVARGSSARGLAPDVSSSQQLVAAVAGGTSVSWADTELASHAQHAIAKTKSKAPIAAAFAAVTLLVIGAGIFIGVKIMHHATVADLPKPSTSMPVTHATPPPAVTTLPVASAEPVANPVVAPIPAPSTTVVAKPTPNPSNIASPVRPKPTRHHNGAAHDTDSPDERN